MKPLVLFSLFILTITSFAQKLEMIEDKDQIIQRARLELDSAMAPGGVLYTFGKENGIQGMFTIDMTIRGRGEVATVFIVNSDSDNFPNQNKLKDRLKMFKFNFKMQKDKSYKFQYIFKFDVIQTN
ncbi:MAG: hypothetical protein NT175_09540 [Bacteroidetes bacterium]|nr:hypothetical protein [Bacteroidota bacterium]